MMNPLNMTGSRILITGSSSGIGQATAILLAKLGCQVILCARNEDRLHSTRAQLTGDGHLVRAFDLSRVELVEDLLKEIVSAVGPLSGIVHCAGVQRTMPLRFEKPIADDPLWRINYHAAVALVTAFRKPSMHTAKASVVMVSSVMGLVGQAGVSAYCASKGAVHAFCRAAALELARDGIRVNCVAPGHVHTMLSTEAQNAITKEQFIAIEKAHLLGIGKPEDVANAIAFLLAETGRWITGTTLVVDGGYTAH